MDTVPDQLKSFMTPPPSSSLRKYSAPTGRYPLPIISSIQPQPTRGRGSLLPMPPNYNEGSYWTLATLRLLNPNPYGSRRRTFPVQVTKISLKMDGRWGKEKPYILEKKWDEWVERRDLIVQKFPQTELILPKLSKPNGFFNVFFPNAKRSNNLYNLNMKELNHFINCLIEKCSKEVVNSKVVQDFFQTEDMRLGIFQVQYDEEPNPTPTSASTEQLPHFTMEHHLQSFRFPNQNQIKTLTPNQPPTPTLKLKVSEPTLFSKPRLPINETEKFNNKIDKILSPNSTKNFPDPLMLFPEPPKRSPDRLETKNFNQLRPLLMARSTTASGFGSDQYPDRLIRPSTAVAIPRPLLMTEGTSALACRFNNPFGVPVSRPTFSNTRSNQPPLRPTIFAPRPTTSASRPTYQINSGLRTNGLLRSAPESIGRQSNDIPSSTCPNTQFSTSRSSTLEIPPRPGIREFKSMQDIRSAANNSKNPRIETSFGVKSACDSHLLTSETHNSRLPSRSPTNPWRKHHRSPSESSSSFGSSLCHPSPISSTSISPILKTPSSDLAIIDIPSQKPNLVNNTIDLHEPSSITCDGSSSLRIVYDAERRKMVAQHSVPPAPFFPIPPQASKPMPLSLKPFNLSSARAQLKRPHTSAGGTTNPPSSFSVALKVIHAESRTNIMLSIHKGLYSLEQIKAKIQSKMLMAGEIKLRENWKMKLLTIDPEELQHQSEHDHNLDSDSVTGDGPKLIDLINGVYKNYPIKKITMRVY
ncbi:hypothetical protein O181_067359 [Austropuccinia psidii MF-1]|uniref:PX domain-containing protein n=1 Tax=Austropuccinia psidii MF-1 TaxID=1389203 RepID=A0A9Q3EV81_9BASI|nr:hypothetical protein [Austropuccinia psidii MF-1]